MAAYSSIASAVLLAMGVVAVRLLWLPVAAAGQEV
jgi:hypothetical protein